VAIGVELGLYQVVLGEQARRQLAGMVAAHQDLHGLV
jgi:hypothetical protein